MYHTPSQYPNADLLQYIIITLSHLLFPAMRIYHLPHITYHTSPTHPPITYHTSPTHHPNALQSPIAHQSPPTTNHLPPITHSSPPIITHRSSPQAPLIQNSRLVDDTLITIGLLSDRNTPPSDRHLPLDSALERLLRCEDSNAHLAISEALWCASSVEEAVMAVEALAHTRLEEFERTTTTSSTVAGSTSTYPITSQYTL